MTETYVVAIGHPAEDDSLILAAGDPDFVVGMFVGSAWQLAGVASVYALTDDSRYEQVALEVLDE